jgi:dsDNA-specific endonuclease/ATPase MutS2
VNRSRLQGWHPESEFRQLIEQVADYINTPTTERKLLMALQADVQKLIDEIKQNKDLVTSVAQALQVQGKQIDDLKTQVSGLQAGQVLTVDDLTAIQGAVTDLGETNTELQTATPANTPGQPVVPAATPTPDPAA